MADDKHRNEEPEVEGHKAAVDAEDRSSLEAEKYTNRDEEPEVEGHKMNRKVSLAPEELGIKLKKTGA